MKSDCLSGRRARPELYRVKEEYHRYLSLQNDHLWTYASWFGPEFSSRRCLAVRDRTLVYWSDLIAGYGADIDDVPSIRQS